MAGRYSVKLGKSLVEVAQHNSNMLVYRVDYKEISAIDNSKLNQFIVYILFEKNPTGMDRVYVGKSKNGVLNRPTSHEDKSDNWCSCFILTQVKDRSFFNDGIIQYLEDSINKRITMLGTLENTTKQTTSGTINNFDKEDCDIYLEEAYDILYILGLDLRVKTKENTEVVKKSEVIKGNNSNAQVYTSNFDSIKEKLFHIKENKKGIEAYGKLLDDGFIVYKNSKIAKEFTSPLKDKGVIRVKALWDKLSHELVILNGVFLKDYVFQSPHEAACIMSGSWSSGNIWVDDEGVSIIKLMGREKKGGTINDVLKKWANSLGGNLESFILYLKDYDGVDAKGFFSWNKGKLVFVICQGSLLLDLSEKDKDFMGDFLELRQKLGNSELLKGNILQADLELASYAQATSIIFSKYITGYTALNRWRTEEGKRFGRFLEGLKLEG